MNQTQMLKAMFGQKEFPIKGQVFTVSQTLIADYNETDEKFICILDAMNADGVDISANDIDSSKKVSKEFEIVEAYVERQPYLGTKQSAEYGRMLKMKRSKKM